MSHDPRTIAFAGVAIDSTDEYLRSDLHAYIRHAFLHMRPTLQLSDTDDLVDLGVLDSLAFVELVAEIEQRYRVTVRDIDITREHFGSIAAMASYIRSRRST